GGVLRAQARPGDGSFWSRVVRLQFRPSRVLDSVPTRRRAVPFRAQRREGEDVRDRAAPWQRRLRAGGAGAAGGSVPDRRAWHLQALDLGAGDEVPSSASRGAELLPLPRLHRDPVWPAGGARAV